MKKYVIQKRGCAEDWRTIASFDDKGHAIGYFERILEHQGDLFEIRMMLGDKVLKQAGEPRYTWENTKFSKESKDSGKKHRRDGDEKFSTHAIKRFTSKMKDLTKEMQKFDGSIKESSDGIGYLVVCGKSRNDHPTMMWVAQFKDQDDADDLAEQLNKDVRRSRCEGATMKFWVEAEEDGQLVGEADEIEVEDEPVLDRDGEEIHVGDWVEFTDPETEDSIMYQVSKVNGEVVVLDREDGECEAFGEECKVRKPSKEMTPGRYEPMRGFNTKQWWVYDNDDDCFIDPPKEVLDLLDKEETEEDEEARLQEIVDKNPDWLYDMAYRFYGDIEI